MNYVVKVAAMSIGLLLVASPAMAQGGAAAPGPMNLGSAIGADPTETRRRRLRLDRAGSEQAGQKCQNARKHGYHRLDLGEVDADEDGEVCVSGSVKPPIDEIGIPLTSILQFGPCPNKRTKFEIDRSCHGRLHHLGIPSNRIMIRETTQFMTST